MDSRRAYVNAVAGVVPEYDVHKLFIDWAQALEELSSHYSDAELAAIISFLTEAASRQREFAKLIGAVG